MKTRALPENFEDFAPYLDWALPSANARTAKRLDSSPEEIRALYDLGLTRVTEALAYLDQLPMDDLPADAQRLLHILFSIAEVRPQIEEYSGAVPEEIVSPYRFARTASCDLL